MRTILRTASPQTRVLVLMMGEQTFAGMHAVTERHLRQNRWLADLLDEFPNATALRMDDYITRPQDLTGPTHFERLVYQRLAAHVIEIARDAAAAATQTAPEAPGAKWYFAITRTTLDADPDQGFRDCIRVAVASAKQNTRLRPHMIYDGPEDEFTEEMRAAGVTVLLHRISFHDRLRHAQEAQRPEWPDYMKTAEGAFLRLEVGQLESEETYVLYTDCDVLFEQDVSIDHLRPEVFAIGPQFDRNSFYEDVNCGVMVLNVDRLRRDRLALVEFMCENFARISGYDQELLQLYYKARWDPLSPVYNWKPHWGPQPLARVVHFHGPKPAAATKLLANPDYRRDDPVFQAWRHWFFVAPAAYDHYLRRWDAVRTLAAPPPAAERRHGR